MFTRKCQPNVTFSQISNFETEIKRSFGTLAIHSNIAQKRKKNNFEKKTDILHLTHLCLDWSLKSSFKKNSPSKTKNN